MSKSKIPSVNLEIPKEFHVYVLECEDGRYYVGVTANLDIRLIQHFQQDGKKYPGAGSIFTERYKPIRLVESILVYHVRKSSGDKPYDAETLITEEYRKKYGEEKVYGGKYRARYPYINNIWW